MDRKADLHQPPHRVLISIVRDDAKEAAEVLSAYAINSDRNTATGRQSLLARAMLRKMLCAETKTETADWTFERTDNSRPIALFRSARCSLAISISHSGPHIVVAAAKAETLGVDIEQHLQTRDISGVAELAFGPGEQKCVHEEGLPAFYRIWTLREALSKATGAGLAEAADRQDRFDIPLANGNTWTQVPDISPPGCWFFHHEEKLSDLSCAVAVMYPWNSAVQPVLSWT